MKRSDAQHFTALKVRHDRKTQENLLVPKLEQESRIGRSGLAEDYQRRLEQLAESLAETLKKRFK
jgi:hypothetical protein